MKRLLIPFQRALELWRAIQVQRLRLHQIRTIERRLLALKSALDASIKTRPASLEEVVMRSKAAAAIKSGEAALAFLKERV